MKILIAIALLISAGAQAQEVEYCFDRTTYPPKVVVVPAGTMCPAGYIKG